MVSATRQREEALQLLSHDMRSPLAAILATLELPENRSTPVSLRRRIADQAMRTLNLADDFIRLAKAQSDNYRFEDIDLAHVAQDAVDAVWPLAQAGGLRVKAPSTDIEFVVMADRGLLTRALVNLLDNAVKFSPAGSEVACLLDLDELNGRPAVKVRITDQAGGMSQAQVDNLFKKFASARKAVSGASGVGLGLLLVDAVVTRHDGVISCESTEGQGTTFAITLPLLEEPAGND
jgi:signal transduction histidine kinase